MPGLARRATCSRAGTASSRATRRSSTSSIPCSTSMPSGSRSRRQHPLAASPSQVAQLPALTSHVWRQDHNGFSHQDPGFIDHVINKKAEVVRVYLPPDANTPVERHRPLPALAQLRQRRHRRQAARAGVARPWTRRSSTAPTASGIWEWASSEQGGDPDVVMACCRRRADAGDAGRRLHPSPRSCLTSRCAS